LLGTRRHSASGLTDDLRNFATDVFQVLSNHFYIGEVKYKNEILPGEQPPIMDRALFEAVRQKCLAQWSHRTIVRNKSDQLLAGLLFDDAGHRMIPTHATKAGVQYRYYVSTPVLHGEAKTKAIPTVKLQNAKRGKWTKAEAPSAPQFDNLLCRQSRGDMP
jgi:hypothetical protein